MDDEAIQELTANLSGKIHRDIHGFYAKYFEHARQASAAKESWTSSPELSMKSEHDLLSWLKATEVAQYGRVTEWSLAMPSSSPSQFHQYLRLLPAHYADDEHQPAWPHIQALGYLHNVSDCSWKDLFLDVCEQARQAFVHQPARMFLHSFIVQGDYIEPWIFDRAGIYSGGVLNVDHDSERIKTLLATYTVMDPDELGASPWPELSNLGVKYIPMSSGERLLLDESPLYQNSDLLGSSLVVYKGKQEFSDTWDWAVKVKWEHKRVNVPGEEITLKLATDRNVWGVTKLVDFQALTSIASLREGLGFDSVRPVSLSNGSDDAAVKLELQNMTLSCFVTSPLATGLSEFTSVRQLLGAIVDSIRAHESLHSNNILHQDISAGNIMISGSSASQSGEEPRGILIDFGLAMELDDILPDGRTAHGSRPFMSIGVMNRKHHTYRHDLESFLYVFIWMAVRGNTEELPDTSILRNWSKPDFGERISYKTQDMSKPGFEKVLDEFLPRFEDVKELARELRTILFRTDGVDEPLWTETDTGEVATRELYGAIINAFNQAIAAIPASL
jgi:hypothetical protein